MPAIKAPYIRHTNATTMFRLPQSFYLPISYWKWMHQIVISIAIFTYLTADGSHIPIPPYTAGIRINYAAPAPKIQWGNQQHKLLQEKVMKTMTEGKKEIEFRVLLPQKCF